MRFSLLLPTLLQKNHVAAGITITALTAFALAACSGSTEGTDTTGSGTGGSGSSAGGGGIGGAPSSSSTGDTGVGGNFTTGVGGGGSGMLPVRLIPNLTGITFYERTGGVEPTSYAFTVDGPELTKRLDDPLTDLNFDIAGASSEYYDVYYSNEDGTFNVDGSYLTISGRFEQALPAGGGLNLAEIGLNFEGAPTEFGNYLASYVALGDNKDETSVEKCIDGDLQTHTTMGNTVGTAERLRLTLGFKSSSGEPK